MTHTKKIELMHYLYGKKKGRTCGECSNLSRYKYRDKSYRKCTVYGVTCSEATDWKCGNIACNMFDKEYDGVPVIKYKSSLFTKSANIEDEPVKPLKGQINMFGDDLKENDK